jgi:hypothetical protein
MASDRLNDLERIRKKMNLCFLPIISRWISLTVNTAPVTQGMIALLTISAL